MKSKASRANPRYSNGARRRAIRARWAGIGAPCALCNSERYKDGGGHMGKPNVRYANGARRRAIRARWKSIGAPCALCGKPI